MKKTFIIAVFFLYISSFAQKQDTLQLKTIESVTIEGKKKLLLERKADRLIFNVEASVASQGMDGAETLANVPMLKVDENLGNISITGKAVSM